MNTQQQKELTQTGQSASYTKQLESSRKSENKQASTLESRPLEGTPFKMVKNENRIYLTIGGAVTTEKTWSTYRKCERWTRRHIPIIQTTFAVINVINQKIKEDGQK